MMFRKSFLLLMATVSLANHVSAAALWLSDLSMAQAQAKAEGKFVLLNFSGSDWCGWCIKLRKEVFLRPQFEDYAKTNLVLVQIDFPKHKPLPPAVQRHNQKLADQFQVQGYPTLIVLDAQGTKRGRISYGAGGPKPFISEIEKLIRPPTSPLPKSLPAKNVDPPRRTGQVPATVEANRVELKLQSINGPRQRRQAVINDHGFSVGETSILRLPTCMVKVRCVEIRERSVIVIVNGGREKRELRLAGGA
jgi:protein disulfide-isomerase